MAFKGSPSSQHQHCTDEAQKAETVLSAVSYIYIYIYIYNMLLSLFCACQYFAIIIIQLLFSRRRRSVFSLLSNATPVGACVQNGDCRLHTGGVGLSFLNRLIFLHS